MLKIIVKKIFPDEIVYKIQKYDKNLKIWLFSKINLKILCITHRNPLHSMYIQFQFVWKFFKINDFPCKTTYVTYF